LLELGAHLLVILNHFVFLNFFPVLLHVLLDGEFAVFHGLLGLLLVCHVAHQHFALQCLDHVLLLVHRLVGPLDLQTAKFVLVVLLLRILASSLNLSVFEFPDTIFLSLESLSIHCVRPVSNSSFRCLLKVSSGVIPHSLVGIFFCLNDLSSDAVKLINGDDSSAFRFLGVAGTHCVDTTRVG